MPVDCSTAQTAVIGKKGGVQFLLRGAAKVCNEKCNYYLGLPGGVRYFRCYEGTEANNEYINDEYKSGVDVICNRRMSLTLYEHSIDKDQAKYNYLNYYLYYFNSLKQRISARGNFFRGDEVHQKRAYKGVAAQGVRGLCPRTPGKFSKF